MIAILAKLPRVIATVTNVCPLRFQVNSVRQVPSDFRHYKGRPNAAHDGPTTRFARVHFRGMYNPMHKDSRTNARKLNLNAETVRLLGSVALKGVQGGVPASSNNPNDEVCCTQVNTCQRSEGRSCYTCYITCTLTW